MEFWRDIVMPLATGLGLFVASGYVLVLARLVGQIVFGAWSRGTKTDLEGRHVMVSGGSSGIGKEVAVEAARRGAKVSILARDPVKLAQAKEEILERVREGGQLQGQASRCLEVICDVGSGQAAVKGAVDGAVKQFGPVHMLVNCAGFCIPRRFEDLTIEDELDMMKVNFHGSSTLIRAVLPCMKADLAEASTGGGRIVLVSSMAGMIGLYGFTGYAGSKFALRGFAESLAMELAPFDITVTIAFPPDTDTPGLKMENEGKPEETKLLSEGAGIFQPHDVARRLLNDAVAGRFMSSVGLDGFFLSTLSSGVAPSCSFLDMAVQVFLLGPFRVYSWFVVRGFYSFIRQKQSKKNSSKKAV